MNTPNSLPESQSALSAYLLLVKLLLVSAAYYLSGKLGLSVAYYGSYLTLFWLPTGIAVAAILCYGWLSWPFIYLGAVLVPLSSGTPLVVSLEIGAGNLLAPVVSAELFKYLNPSLNFNRRQDIFLLLIAASVGMLISSTNGVLTLWHAHLVPRADLFEQLASWWMGDTVGVLLATPLILAYSRNSLQALLLQRKETDSLDAVGAGHRLAGVLYQVCW